MTQPDQQKLVVLVVEDEPVVMLDAMQALEDAGFEVVDAYDSEHALVRLEERPDIAALFTDVNMPGRYDGVTLAHMVHARRPDVLLLITSGAVKVPGEEIPNDGRFIPKPYDGRKVAHLIHELLD